MPRRNRCVLEAAVRARRIGLWLAGARGVSARILIVDDEANACSALSELLRDQGYVVAAVIDGIAAQGSMAEFHPDLLLTDVHLPRMSGLELAAAARSSKEPPAVVLMSAQPEPRGNAIPFVTKPIDFEHLLGVVEKEIARRKAPRNTDERR
jgi:CheY-like chemotaxis protein